MQGDDSLYGWLTAVENVAFIYPDLMRKVLPAKVNYKP